MASVASTSPLHHQCLRPHHHRRRRPLSAVRFLGDPACYISSIPILSLFSSSSLPSLSSPRRSHLYNSFLGFASNPSLWKLRCRRVGFSGPPPPEPQPDPPPVKSQSLFTGMSATFSRFQEAVQIFFAVLFWLSLFFWASAWEDRSNGGQNKRNRFRR